MENVTLFADSVLARRDNNQSGKRKAPKAIAFVGSFLLKDKKNLGIRQQIN
ncbi:hypothetical protein OH492_10615 [Vibrio chagasii]|nr:hypothetical protein [Vibrio chagasii]